MGTRFEFTCVTKSNSIRTFLSLRPWELGVKYIQSVGTSDMGSNITVNLDRAEVAPLSDNYKTSCFLYQGDQSTPPT